MMSLVSILPPHHPLLAKEGKKGVVIFGCGVAALCIYRFRDIPCLSVMNYTIL